MLHKYTDCMTNPVWVGVREANPCFRSIWHQSHTLTGLHVAKMSICCSACSYLSISNLLFAEKETEAEKDMIYVALGKTSASEDMPCDLTVPGRAGSHITVYLRNHIFLDVKSPGSSECSWKK